MPVILLIIPFILFLIQFAFIMTRNEKKVSDIMKNERELFNQEFSSK